MDEKRLREMDAELAKGMTTREITNTFKEMYDVDISPTLISKVTDSVKEQVVEWQNRPLENLYPIIYLDCIAVKVKQDGRIINKSVFLALAINKDRHLLILRRFGMISTIYW